MALNWNGQTETLDGFFLRGLGMPYIRGVVNWLAVPEMSGNEPGQIRESDAPEIRAFRNSRLLYLIDNSLSICEFAGRSWVAAEALEQGVWVGDLDELVPREEAFANRDELYYQLTEDQLIGEGDFPAIVGLSEQAYILALQYLGPARVRTMAKRLKSVIAYESSDMESWSAVEAVAIGDDDVLKLAACRLDDTTDRVVVFLQKAGGVFKLVVLDGELGERLDEWEFTSPELAEAIAADVHVRTRKIDLAVQDGTVYAFWDHYMGEFGDRTSGLRYVLWRPDVPAGPEEPQAGPDVSATSPAQTDPAGVGETSGRQE